MADFRINVVVDPTRVKTGAAVVKRELDGVAGRASNMGAILRRALGLVGGGLIVRKSIGILADFGQEMSTVGAVTNATAEDFALLEERAISLGTNTRFTATQAASGLTELARAGLSVSDSLEAVGTSLTLAQAGGVSIADAAAITTTALKVFNLEASRAGTIADTLVISANSAKTNVAEMGQAFTFVAANAADLNVNVQDTSAALAILAEGGLTATRGGTALRAVLLGLAAPTGAAAAAIKDAGLELGDVDIKTRGLVPVLQTLADAQLDSAAKAAIFGKRFSAASSILFNNLDLFDELNGKFDTLGGEAQRVSEVMDDNLNGSILAVQSAFEGLILRLGQNGAGGALRSFIDALTTGLRSAAENIEQFIHGVEGLAFVLGTTLARRAIPAAIGGLKSLGVAILTNPIGAFATVLTLSIGALLAFRDQITLTEGSFTTLADVAQSAFDQIKSIVDSFVPLFSSVGDQINDTLGGVFDGFTLDLQTVLLGIGAFADASIGIFLGLGNSLVSLFTGIPKVVASALLTVLGGINNFIEGSIDRTVSFFKALGTTAKSVALGVSVFVREINLSLTQLAQGQFEAAAQTASQASDLIKGQLGGIGKTFTNTFAAELNRAGSTRLLDPIVNQFEGAGADLAAEMSEGFNNGLNFSGASDFAVATLAGAEAIGRQREALAAQAEAQAAANEQTAKAVELAGQVAPAVDTATESIGSLSNSLTEGLNNGLKAGLAGLTDVSGAAESLVVNGFGAAEDAIVQFATTGEADMAAFVDGILADLARLLARQALLGLLNAFTGGAAGGGGAAGIASLFGGARAKGGPVNPNQAFLVGEEGPELFVPPGAGTIKTNAETMGAAPQVNVAPPSITVVNTNDPADTIAAMDTAQGTQVIMNAITQNPSLIRNALQ